MAIDIFSLYHSFRIPDRHSLGRGDIQPGRGQMAKDMATGCIRGSHGSSPLYFDSGVC